MVWGVWVWVYGFGCMALGEWFGIGPIAFGHMAFGACFLAHGFGRMVVGLWFSCGRKALGIGFWAYGFGRIAWLYDFGGRALQTSGGQAQKYIPILNRKINH